MVLRDAFVQLQIMWAWGEALIAVSVADNPVLRAGIDAENVVRKMR